VKWFIAVQRQYRIGEVQITLAQREAGLDAVTTTVVG